MTIVQELARFVVDASYEKMSEAARHAIKLHILDALGCAIGALDGSPIKIIRSQIDEFGGAPLTSLIGGGKNAPDRTAFYNSALVRYLDFNDSYLAKGETCHPSDNLGAVLAAAEYANRQGKDLITALAVAYQVQCRLSDEAPVRSHGFDHTTQGAYAVAAGVSKALGLDADHAANAIAISGTAYNALRITRTGTLSNWKGLAYPDTVFGATHATFLAKNGITGPMDVFEGNKGFMEAIAGKFHIDWEKENLEAVTHTVIKEFNAEMHSQSALEGILELKAETGFTPEQVDQIHVRIFDVAYHIIGGGEEGSKKEIHTKEQADHSLPYMLAVAILDGTVGPEQYNQERINRPDVQQLLQKVNVEPWDEYSGIFPKEMPCQISITLKDGNRLQIEKRTYRGFYTQPMTWEQVRQKFNTLTQPFTTSTLREQIADCIENLENQPVSQLTQLLASAGKK